MSWQNRADLAIAQGALTNSKRPSTFVEHVYPTHVSHGKGAFLFSENKSYVDYICGLGTNLVGYGHTLLAEAIASRYLKGSTLSLSTELEVEVAEKLKSVAPWTDVWKFTKSGTEACAAALKIARAHTGRNLILSDGYHGWSDDFVSLTEPALGVPKRDWMAKFDDSLLENAAAVIIEPVVTDYSKERREFLESLLERCKKAGALVIFDEIITGFRFPQFSVSKYWGLEPDLILFGKAMGGGLPLSAIGGKKEVMNGEYFISGTFFGETCSLAACSNLIDLLRRDETKYNVKDLWAAGQHFLDSFNKLSPALKISGYPARGVFEGDAEVKALFWQEACQAGLLFGPSWFFNFPLADQTVFTIPICRDILNRIKCGSVRLIGKMPQTPFAQKVRSA